MRQFAVITLLCCATLLPAVAQAGRTASLTEPGPIEVTASATPDQIQQGIKSAMTSLRWTPDNEHPGYVEGKYTGGNYWVRIAVSCAGHTVSIRYLTSNGLSFEEKGDRRLIHANYNKWVTALASAIPRSVERAASQ